MADRSGRPCGVDRHHRTPPPRCPPSASATARGAAASAQLMRHPNVYLWLLGCRGHAVAHASDDGSPHGDHDARTVHRRPLGHRHDADGRQDAGGGVPPDPRPLPGGGRQPRRHRRCLRGRRLGGDARAVAAPAPRRGRARHQVPLRGLRSGRPGARTGPDRQGVRRQPAAPGRRRDRPLPGARARSRHAARGLARGARRARARRQGARARRLQLPRLAAGVGGRHPGPRGLGAVRLAAAPVLARGALDRDRDPAVLPRRRARRDPVGPARRRLPQRQVPARRAAAGGQPDRGRGGRLRGGLRPPRDRAPFPGGRRGGRDRRGARGPIPQVAIAWLLGTEG